MSTTETTKVNLKAVAARVGLAPCSVSAVLNDTVASRSIPQATRDRIIRAAAELNYRPNFWARSLRTKRTRMVAVVTPDFGRASVARVVAAAQDTLHRKGYMLVLGTLGTSDMKHSASHLQQRGIEGLIAIDAALPSEVDIPVAAVDLSYLASKELIGEGIHSWLKEMGVSAAKTIMREIESAKPAKHIAIRPTLAPACFDTPGTGTHSYSGERNI